MALSAENIDPEVPMTMLWYYDDVLTSENKVQWINAMKIEIGSYFENNTWTLVPTPTPCKLISLW